MAPLQEEWYCDIEKFSIKYTTQTSVKPTSINLGSEVLDIKLADNSYEDCQSMQLSVAVT